MKTMYVKIDRLDHIKSLHEKYSKSNKQAAYLSKTDDLLRVSLHFPFPPVDGVTTRQFHSKMEGRI